MGLTAGVAHRELAHGRIDSFDLDQLVVDLWFAVAAAALDADFCPLCVGERLEIGDQLGAALAQGQPADPACGELVKDLVGGEFGVEHEQAGIGAADVLPVVGERDHFACLFGLGQLGV